MVADEELISELRALRRLMYRHPPLNIQRLLARFLAQGDYDAHLRQYRSTYLHKHEELQRAVDRHLQGCHYAANEGAAAFWMAAPPGINTQKLAWAAAHRSIVIEPGFRNFLDADPSQQHFRLGLHAIRQERIAPGIQLLAEALEQV